MYPFFDKLGIDRILSTAMKTPTLSVLEQTVFTLAHEQYETLLNTLRSPEYQTLEHGDVEQFVHQEGTELLRRLFQGHLDLRAANEVQYPSLVGSESTDASSSSQGYPPSTRDAVWRGCGHTSRI